MATHPPATAGGTDLYHPVWRVSTTLGTGGGAAALDEVSTSTSEVLILMRG